MRLPWQQLSTEGKRRAKAAGVLLGIGPWAGVGYVADLWEAALDLAPDGDFTGTMIDAAVLVAHAGGVPGGFAGGFAGVVEILQRVGLVATAPALRVRGLDRYASAWRKNRKLRSTPAEPPRVPKRTRSKPGAQDVDVDVDRDKEEKKKLRAAPAVDARHAPLVQALCAAYLEIRKAEYPFTPRDAAHVKQLLAMGEPSTLEAAWRKALASSTYPLVRTLGELQKALAHFTGEGPRGDVRKGRVGAEDFWPAHPGKTQDGGVEF